MSGKEDTTLDARSDARSRDRAGTMASILRVAIELFSAHGFEAVSIRQIAARAGVSHTLVHKYFGTKEDLLQVALAARDDRYATPLHGIPDPREALRETTRALLRNRGPLRIMLYSALEGRTAQEVGGSWPVMSTFAERFFGEHRAGQPGSDPIAVDPRMVAAALAALLLGWSVMERVLLEQVGLEDLDEEQVLDALLELELRMMGRANDAGPDAGAAHRS